MNSKKIALLLGGILLAAALWLRWWLQPERQIPRAQARLVSALERRDFAAFSALIATDYGDRWGHDSAVAVARCKEVFSQFATLSIEREGSRLDDSKGRWVLHEKIRMKGLGAPLAMAARDVVNGLHEPFEMEWRRRSSRPWDWELKNVNQPELELP